MAIDRGGPLAAADDRVHTRTRHAARPDQRTVAVSPSHSVPDDVTRRALLAAVLTQPLSVQRSDPDAGAPAGSGPVTSSAGPQSAPGADASSVEQFSAPGPAPVSGPPGPARAPQRTCARHIRGRRRPPTRCVVGQTRGCTQPGNRCGPLGAGTTLEKFGKPNSPERRAAVDQQMVAGLGSGAWQGLLAGAGIAAVSVLGEIGVAKLAAKGGVGSASKAAGPVGAVVGGLVAVVALATKDWKKSAEVRAAWNTGTGDELIANRLAAAAEWIDIIGNVIDVLGGLAGIIALGCTALVIPTAGVTAPGAAFFGKVAFAAGLAGLALSIIKTVLQGVSLYYRRKHLIEMELTKESELAQQTDALTDAAQGVGGFVGGMAGGFAVQRGTKGGRFDPTTYDRPPNIELGSPPTVRAMPDPAKAAAAGGAPAAPGAVAAPQKPPASDAPALVSHPPEASPAPDTASPPASAGSAPAGRGAPEAEAVPGSAPRTEAQAEPGAPAAKESPPSRQAETSPEPETARPPEPERAPSDVEQARAQAQDRHAQQKSRIEEDKKRATKFWTELFTEGRTKRAEDHKRFIADIDAAQQRRIDTVDQGRDRAKTKAKERSARTSRDVRQSAEAAAARAEQAGDAAGAKRIRADAESIIATTVKPALDEALGHIDGAYDAKIAEQRAWGDKTRAEAKARHESRNRSSEANQDRAQQGIEQRAREAMREADAERDAALAKAAPPQPAPPPPADTVPPPGSAAAQPPDPASPADATTTPPPSDTPPSDTTSSPAGATTAPPPPPQVAAPSVPAGMGEPVPHLTPPVGRPQGKPGTDALDRHLEKMWELEGVKGDVEDVVDAGASGADIAESVRNVSSGVPFDVDGVAQGFEEVYRGLMPPEPNEAELQGRWELLRTPPEQVPEPQPDGATSDAGVPDAPAGPDTAPEPAGGADGEVLECVDPNYTPAPTTSLEVDRLSTEAVFHEQVNQQAQEQRADTEAEQKARTSSGVQLQQALTGATEATAATGQTRGKVQEAEQQKHRGGNPIGGCCREVQRIPVESRRALAVPIVDARRLRLRWASDLECPTGVGEIGRSAGARLRE